MNIEYDQWTGDDSEALQLLRGNFSDTAGLIQPRAGYKPTEADFAAISYLCNEWDYAYDPTPKVK